MTGARIALDARKWRDGGIGTYLRALARHLPEAMPDVGEWVAFVRPSELRDVAAEAPKFRPVPVDAAEWSLRERFAVADACRANRIELLHAPHFSIPHRPGCPVVVTIHDAIPADPRFSGGAKRLLAKAMIRQAFRGAAATLTVSGAARADLARLCSLPIDRITVVHNGVEPHGDRTVDEAKRAVEHRLGTPQGGELLVAIASHRSHKGLPILVEALSRVHYPGHLSLVLVGSEQGGEKVVPLLAALPREWRRAVHLVPPVDADFLSCLYRAARGFVSPSLAEGFGLTVLEAMAAGCPVIASDIPPHREIGGEVPLYVEAGSVSSLSSALDDLLSGRLDTGPHRAAGLVHVRSFTWSKAAAETAEIYSRVLARK